MKAFLFLSFFLFLKILFIHFQRRGRKGEREGEKYQCGVASCTPPTGDLACNPGRYPDWDSNQRPFGSQSVLNLLSYTSQGKVFIFLITNVVLSTINLKKKNLSYPYGGVVSVVQNSF